MEEIDTFWAPPRYVEGQHLPGIEASLRRLRGDERRDEHAGTREQHEQKSDLRRGERLSRMRSCSGVTAFATIVSTRPRVAARSSRTSRPQQM
jgi:hypothetical protein